MRKPSQGVWIASLVMGLQVAMRLLATNHIADWLAVATIFVVSLWGAALLWRKYIDPPDDEDFAGNFRVAPTAAAMGRSVDPREAARRRDYQAVLWFMVALAMTASLLWSTFFLLGGRPQ